MLGADRTADDRWVLADAVVLATARLSGTRQRPAGLPDLIANADAVLHLIPSATEIEGALRHGELVVMGAAPTGHPRHAGPVDHALVGAAVRAGVSVLPVA